MRSTRRCVPVCPDEGLLGDAVDLLTESSSRWYLFVQRPTDRPRGIREQDSVDRLLRPRPRWPSHTGSQERGWFKRSGMYSVKRGEWAHVQCPSGQVRCSRCCCSGAWTGCGGSICIRRRSRSHDTFAHIHGSDWLVPRNGDEWHAERAIPKGLPKFHDELRLFDWLDSLGRHADRD